MKNKNLLFVAIAVVVVLVLGGLFLVNRSNKTEEPTNEFVDENIEEISADSIGLKFEASTNKKQVRFTIGKPAGIEKVEYEVSYEADSAGGSSEDGETSGKISRGVAGEEEIDPSDGPFTSKYLDLGSCSSGTCRFDVGVEEVDLLLKITKTDGKIYQAQSSLKL